MEPRYRKYTVLGLGCWRAMRSRCLNKNDPYYPKYGGTGRFVCQGLQSSFKYFLSIIGNRPALDYTVDRIDNNLNYTCGSCEDCLLNNYSLNIRWATRRQQAANTSKSGKYPGVYLNLKTGSWKARVYFEGKRYRLGVYTSPELANQAILNFLAIHNTL